MTTKLNIFNNRGKDYKLYIEPYGDLYDVKADETVHLHSAVDLGNLMEITIEEGEVSLWIYGAGDHQESLVVEIGGVVQEKQ